MCHKTVLTYALTLEHDHRSGTVAWWLTQRAGDSPGILVSEGQSGSWPAAWACLWSLVDLATSGPSEMLVSEH